MTLINVLSPTAYADCHITGSINVPLDTLAEYAQGLEKDANLIVYCASYGCPLSKGAWKLLTDQGFSHVRAYEGGTAEWYHLGYPTEGPAALPYLHESHTQSLDHEQIKTIDAEELKQLLAA